MVHIKKEIKKKKQLIMITLLQASLSLTQGKLWRADGIRRLISLLSSCIRQSWAVESPTREGWGHNFWGKAAQICSEKFFKGGAAGNQNGGNSQQLWDRCPWWRGSAWVGPPIPCLGTFGDRVGRRGVASSVLGSVHPCYRSPSLQSREVCMATGLGGAGRIECLDGFLAWPQSS